MPCNECPSQFTSGFQQGIETAANEILRHSTEREGWSDCPEMVAVSVRALQPSADRQFERERALEDQLHRHKWLNGLEAENAALTAKLDALEALIEKYDAGMVHQDDCECLLCGLKSLLAPPDAGKESK
jgi:hypothetical protein